MGFFVAVVVTGFDVATVFVVSGFGVAAVFVVSGFGVAIVVSAGLGDVAAPVVIFVAGFSSGLSVIDVITVSDAEVSDVATVLLLSFFDCSVSAEELIISELVSDETSGLSTFLLHEHNKIDVASNKAIIRFLILHLINYNTAYILL